MRLQSAGSFRGATRFLSLPFLTLLHMKFPFFSLFLAFIHFSNALAQTSFVSGLNSTSLDIVNVGTPNQYPSEIEISGGLPYIVGVKVVFPVFYMDGMMSELDLLLESPSGKKVMLMSECPCGQSLFVPKQLGISSYSARDLPGQPIQSSTFYRPVNLGTFPDTFPDPGPGIIAPGYASFAPLINEDPNGIWRLWIVSDNETVWSYFSLSDGWELSIETSPVPVCPQPEPPKVLAVTDTKAQITWQGNGPATHWDIFWRVQKFNVNAPDENTVPMVSNWANDTLLMENLLPREAYEVYVRSVCPDGSRSTWTGQVVFKTPYTPCLYANPISLDQLVDCKTVSSLTDFEMQSSCGTSAPNWIFRFTPQDTGAYWLEYSGFNAALYSAAFWQPDTAANCPKTGWKCLGQYSGAPSSRILDTLMGGVPYFLMFQNGIEPPAFRLTRCPSIGIKAEQQTWPDLVEPFSATFYMSSANDNLSGSFDLFYTNDSTIITPDHDTPPSEKGAVLLKSELGRYRLHTDSLTPSAKYRLWARSYCEDGTQNSAWTGPFFFRTGTFCGAWDSVWFDQITDRSARINILTPPDYANQSRIKYKVWVGGHPYSNSTYGGVAGEVSPDSAGQVLSKDIHLLQPDTTYQVYLQASCSLEGTKNPVHGPFLLKTKSGCFTSLRDIECGEVISGIHFYIDSLNAFYSDACVDNGPTYKNLNEALFRFKASMTGDIELWGISGAFTRMGYWYKDAAQVCNKSGFIFAGCEEQHSPTIIPVEAGHSYYLLTDANMWPGYFEDNSFQFAVYGCAPPCPTVDSIWLDAKTSTSATLRWPNVAPGATYQISYRPEDADSVKIASTTDTTFTLTGLEPSELYRFRIKTYCPGGEVRAGNDFIFQLGDHLVTQGSVFNRCNPRFMLPGSTVSANYEVFKLQVPVDGVYRLRSKYLSLHVYEIQFDPENPTNNLVASKAVPPFYNRADTLLNLQSGKTYYWVISNSKQNPIYPGFNVNNNNLQILVDGPAAAQVSAPTWNGWESAPHGKVPLEGSFWHTGTCRDTSGWVHFYKIADDPTQLNSDALLLSLKTDVQADVLNQLPLLFAGYPSAALITNPPALFVQNPDGWYEMNRIWLMNDLQPAQQIDEDFKVRFYYTQADFERMKTAIESAGGQLGAHEALYFHKINGFHHYDNIFPGMGHGGILAAAAYDSIGYWSYANGPEATTSTWRHGSFAGEHYAEMVIHGFSGGGGGASVNGKSVFDPVSKTIDLGQVGMLLFTPNPTTGTFSIELPQAAALSMRFRITDLSGRLVLEKQMEVGTVRQTVYVEALPSGLYFLQVVSEGRVLAVEKFVKE